MKKKHSFKLLVLSVFISLFLHIFVAYKYKTLNNKPAPPESERSGNSRGGIEDEKDSIWVNYGAVPCEYYNGIGIQFTGLTNTVMYVAPNSPAHKAGIKIGDELITDLWKMNLEFGQKIDIVVLRDGKQLVFSVTIDRICQQ